jgi:general secretion pathway protein C
LAAILKGALIGNQLGLIAAAPCRLKPGFVKQISLPVTWRPQWPGLFNASAFRMADLSTQTETSFYPAPPARCLRRFLASQNCRATATGRGAFPMPTPPGWENGALDPFPFAVLGLAAAKRGQPALAKAQLASMEKTCANPSRADDHQRARVLPAHPERAGGSGRRLSGAAAFAGKTRKAMSLLMINSQIRSIWVIRGITALLWMLAAASAFYWGSRMTGRGNAAVGPAAASAAPADNAPARQAAIAKLLGAMPSVATAPLAGPGPAERFVLLGVIASMTGKGAALISVDGQPARPLVPGAQIAPGYVLESVGRREAVLVDGAPVPVKTVLSLPALDATPAAVPASGGAAASAGVPKPTAAVPAAPRTDASPPPRQDSRVQPRSPMRP